MLGIVVVNLLPCGCLCCVFVFDILLLLFFADECKSEQCGSLATVYFQSCYAFILPKKSRTLCDTSGGRPSLTLATFSFRPSVSIMSGGCLDRAYFIHFDFVSRPSVRR